MLLPVQQGFGGEEKGSVSVILLLEIAVVFPVTSSPAERGFSIRT